MFPDDLVSYVIVTPDIWTFNLTLSVPFLYSALYYETFVIRIFVFMKIEKK